VKQQVKHIGNNIYEITLTVKINSSQHHSCSSCGSINCAQSKSLDAVLKDEITGWCSSNEGAVDDLVDQLQERIYNYE
jgi:hypothetical protein